MQGAFFREPYHCALLARVLPDLARRRRLEVWSAGCGSGEEAWSIAMLVEEAGLPFEAAIVATDGDPAAIARAGDGVYRDDEMRGVSAERRRRHFVRGAGPRRGLWRVVSALRDGVEFAALDLEDAWPERGRFDVVCCHDAIALLDARSSARLVRRFADVLAPGGIMLLGPTQAASQSVPGLEPHGRAAYRKIAA